MHESKKSERVTRARRPDEDASLTRLRLEFDSPQAHYIRNDGMKDQEYLIVVGTMTEKDGKILLVQEKQPAAYKLWNTPAGWLDKGESLVDGAKRETKEETGYEVQVNGLLGIYVHNPEENPGKIVIKIVFRASITGGELMVPEDELLQC